MAALCILIWHAIKFYEGAKVELYINVVRNVQTPTLSLYIDTQVRMYKLVH